MAVRVDPSIVRRSITILVVAPSVVYLVTTSYLLMAFLIWALTFIAMVEWTAMKRHLKVTLLWAASSVNRVPSSLSSSPTHGATGSGASATPPRIDSGGRGGGRQRQPSPGGKSTTTRRRRSSMDGTGGAAATATAAASRRHEAEAGGGSDDGDDDHRPAMAPFANSALELEYPLPVAKTNWFIVCKCFASSLVTCGAVVSPDLFHLGIKLYFLFWVLFTLMGRNRAETTAVAAKKRIGNAAAVGGVVAAVSPVVSAATTNAQAMSDVFHALELHVIAEFFTTELFLSFCMEYFGFVWITGLSYSMLIYRVPRVGVLLMITVLISNWANDIAALVIGRTLKGHTRPLYPKLSPNKSLEGAIAGVLANGVVASAMVVCFGAHLNFGTAYPGTVFFVIGLVLGALGVMGDLLQSLFKRTSRLKDTGAVFPGHGGVLDRIDGLLVVYPVAYWMLWIGIHVAGVVQVDG